MAAPRTNPSAPRPAMHSDSLTDQVIELMRELRAMRKFVRWEQAYSHFGALQVGVSKSHVFNSTNYDLTIVEVQLTLDTAPTGDDVIVDILKNGTSIYTTTANRPTIADGASSPATIIATLPDDIDLLPGDRLTPEIIQVGSTTAGSDMVLQVAAVT